jgi:hypothetical protein
VHAVKLSLTSVLFVDARSEEHTANAFQAVGSSSSIACYQSAMRRAFRESRQVGV